MSLILFILVVIVVLALAMWAVYYLPFPPGFPAWSKNFLYVILLIVAIIAILFRSGLAAAQTPTPIQTQKKTDAQPLAKPVYRGYGQTQWAAGSWTRFKGATKCVQVGSRVDCDNGYSGPAR